MCKTQGCYTDIKFKYLPDTVPDTGVLLLAGAALAARGKGSGRGFLILPIVRLLICDLTERGAPEIAAVSIIDMHNSTT